MKVTCPRCNTTYDMKSSIPSGSIATVVCAVCQTQLEVIPRGAMYLYKPLVIVRTVNQEPVVLEPEIING